MCICVCLYSLGADGQTAEGKAWGREGGRGKKQALLSTPAPWWQFVEALLCAWKAAAELQFSGGTAVWGFLLIAPPLPPEGWL